MNSKKLIEYLTEEAEKMNGPSPINMESIIDLFNATQRRIEDDVAAENSAADERYQQALARLVSMKERRAADQRFRQQLAEEVANRDKLTQETHTKEQND